MNQDYFASVTADQLLTVMSENLFSNVLNVMQCGVQLLRAVRDEGGRITDFEIVYANKAGSLYKGTSSSEKKLSDNGGVSSIFFNKILSAMKQGADENHIEIKDPERPDHNIIYTITRLIDGALITNEKCDQQSESPIRTLLEITDLNKANEVMKLALRSANAGLGHSDYRTGTTIWDEKGKELMNLPEAEQYSMDEWLAQIYHEDRERVAAYARECANEGKDFLMEYRVPHETGLRYILGTGIFRKDERGNLTESYGLVIDITDAKHAEEKIFGLNKSLALKNHELESANSEIKTFNSIASNDYRETLQKLYTNLEFILTRDAKNLSDSGRANLRKMQSSIQKMKLLTEDIVSFSNIHTQDETPVEVNLHHILDRAIEDLENKINESNALITAEELPTIKGFPLLLSILFNHLLDNALKFYKPAGSPQIHIKYAMVTDTGKEEQGNIQFHRISFIDDGIGFDQEEAEKLFTMFYRLHEKNKYKGSGIGLAISKKIMDLHKGFILAESVPAGAVFNCYFPAQPL